MCEDTVESINVHAKLVGFDQGLAHLAFAPHFAFSTLFGDERAPRVLFEIFPPPSALLTPFISSHFLLPAGFPFLSWSA